MGSPTMVMNARKYQSWVGSAVKASAAASASAAATSSSAASSSSAAASSPTSAAAPAAEVLGLEALDLRLGTGGRGPSLCRVLGGLGLDDRPDVFTDLLTPHDLQVGGERSTWTVADAPPTAVHRY